MCANAWHKKLLYKMLMMNKSVSSNTISWIDLSWIIIESQEALDSSSTIASGVGPGTFRSFSERLILGTNLPV